MQRLAELVLNEVNGEFSHGMLDRAEAGFELFGALAIGIFDCFWGAGNQGSEVSGFGCGFWGVAEEKFFVELIHDVNVVVVLEESD